VLGWAPSTTLASGLARTISYFEDLLARGDTLPDLSARHALA
jgi:hypothetical protein